jgi:hypothetical protein
MYPDLSDQSVTGLVSKTLHMPQTDFIATTQSSYSLANYLAKPFSRVAMAHVIERI